MKNALVFAIEGNFPFEFLLLPKISKGTVTE